MLAICITANCAGLSRKEKTPRTPPLQKQQKRPNTQKTKNNEAWNNKAIQRLMYDAADLVVKKQNRKH